MSESIQKICQCDGDGDEETVSTFTCEKHTKYQCANCFAPVTIYESKEHYSSEIRIRFMPTCKCLPNYDLIKNKLEGE